MTKAKVIARTLLNVLDHSVIRQVLDRSQPIPKSVLEEVKNWWTMDLINRRPAPAYVNDEFKGTDLDLATFMYALAGRCAVINIPQYENLRGSTKKEGEYIVSKENRHGNVVGVLGNKEVFSFSVKIFDQNVVTTDTTGAYRNFALTGLEGDWHKGWSTIQFLPSATENDFIIKNKLWSSNSIVFKNFVHPNRWVSLYGAPYFITKAIIDRLTEDSAHLNKEIKRLKALGYTIPLEAVPYPPSTVIGPKKSVTVTAMNVIANLPEITGKYSLIEESLDSLQKAINLRKYYMYEIIPALRFATRCTELAYFNRMKDQGKHTFPTWIRHATWEKDFIYPGKKTKFERLVLFQPGVGQYGVSLCMRTYPKKQQVAANF